MYIRESAFFCVSYGVKTVTIIAKNTHPKCIQYTQIISYTDVSVFVLKFTTNENSMYYKVKFKDIR